MWWDWRMGCDAPRPFVPGSWVPAPVSGYGAGPAGMTLVGLSEPLITQIFADGL